MRLIGVTSPRSTCHQGSRSWPVWKAYLPSLMPSHAPRASVSVVTVPGAPNSIALACFSQSSSTCLRNARPPITSSRGWEEDGTGVKPAERTVGKRKPDRPARINPACRPEVRGRLISTWLFYPLSHLSAIFDSVRGGRCLGTAPPNVFNCPAAREPWGRSPRAASAIRRRGWPPRRTWPSARRPHGCECRFRPPAAEGPLPVRRCEFLVRERSRTARRSVVARSTLNVFKSRLLTPINRAPTASSPIQLSFVVHLDQRRQAGFGRQRMEPLQLRVAQNGGDQQNRVRPPLDRLQDLPLINDEILAQQRQPHRRANLLQVFQCALEELLIRKHGKATCAGCLVLPGDPDRVEVRPYEARRRRCLLYLRNQRDRALGRLRAAPLQSPAALPVPPPQSLKSAAETARCGSRSTSRCFCSTMVSRIVTKLKLQLRLWQYAEDCCAYSPLPARRDFGPRASDFFRPSTFGFRPSHLTPPHPSPPACAWSDSPRAARR